MLKQEFERLAKRTVTSEQYEHIEKLYMISEMDKYQFVKTITQFLKSVPETEPKHPIMIMMTDRNMENAPTEAHVIDSRGHWTVQVELLNIDIKTGKRIFRIIPDTYAIRQGYDIKEWDRRTVIKE